MNEPGVTPALFVPSRDAKKALGVREETLRKWADAGSIPSIKTPGGQRLYNIKGFLQLQQSHHSQPTESQSNPGSSQQPVLMPPEKINICYCRVSSQGQKDDLQRQVLYMSKQFPQHRVITDIGSGINFKRRGLRTILELACKGMVSSVVVAYRDRLCRFAFELLEWLLRIHGVSLVVLHESVEESGSSGELAEDLLAIVQVFSCRVNGKRKYSPSHPAATQADKQPKEVNQRARRSVQKAEAAP